MIRSSGQFVGMSEKIAASIATRKRAFVLETLPPRRVARGRTVRVSDYQQAKPLQALRSSEKALVVSRGPANHSHQKTTSEMGAPCSRGLASVS